MGDTIVLKKGPLGRIKKGTLSSCKSSSTWWCWPQEKLNKYELSKQLREGMKKGVREYTKPLRWSLPIHQDPSNPSHRSAACVLLSCILQLPRFWGVW